MKRGMSSLAAPQSAITQTTVGPNLLQSVWRNVNKSGSLPLSLPLPLSLSAVLRPTRRRLRAPPHIRDAVHHAGERARRPNWPKFAEGNTFPTDRELCRPTKVGVLASWNGAGGLDFAKSVAFTRFVSGYFPSRRLSSLSPKKAARRTTSTQASPAATES